MKITRDKGIIENASAPTSADVYRVGTIWVDTTNDLSYTLTDVTAGVSTWLKTAGIGSGSIDLEGDYLLDDQTTTNMMSKGTVYRFDATDDVITVTGADLFDSTEGAVNVHFRFVDKAAQQVLVASADTATTGKYFWMGINTTGVLGIAKLDTGVSATANFVLGSTVMEDGKEYIATFKSNGSAYSMDLNGVAETLTVSTGVNNGDWFGDLTGRDSFTIGALTRTSSVNFAKCEIGEVLVANFYPTAAEVKSLISGNLKFAWQYGSQTELVTNGAFAADTDWGHDGGWTIAGGVGVSAGTQSAIASMNQNIGLTVGKDYRISVDWARTSGTALIIAEYDGSSYITLDTISATGSGTETLEWTSVSSNGLIYFQVTGSWVGTIDNVSIVQLGAVALYTQDSISETVWYDKANGNDGAVTGASVLNPPSVTPLLAMHTIVALVEPGGTAGTNIDVTDNSSTDGTWNPVSTSNAVNMTNDGGAFGSWTLTVSGQVLTLALGNIVGFLSASIGTHDINSSSASDIYTISASVSGGNLLLRIKLVGSTSAVDWRTVMDAGDLAAVFVSYVTAT